MPVLLGALSSLFLGTADFHGQRITRRSDPISMVATAMVGGTAMAALLVLLVPSEFRFTDFMLGVGSGVFVAVALTTLYHGMIISSVGVVAPIASLISAVVPVAADAIGGVTPSGLALSGMAIAVCSLVLTSISPDLDGDIRRGIGFALAAGLSFGTALVLLGGTDIDSGMWPVLAQRGTGFVALAPIAIVRTGSPLLPRPLRNHAAAAGLLMGIGIACVVAGTQRGSIGSVAVAGSMFPAVTTALAAVFERATLRWWQTLGLIGALAGVALIAAG